MPSIPYFLFSFQSPLSFLLCFPHYCLNSQASSPHMAARMTPTVPHLIRSFILSLKEERAFSPESHPNWVFSHIYLNPLYQVALSAMIGQARDCAHPCDRRGLIDSSTKCMLSSSREEKMLGRKRSARFTTFLITISYFWLPVFGVPRLKKLCENIYSPRSLWVIPFYRQTWFSQRGKRRWKVRRKRKRCKLENFTLF